MTTRVVTWWQRSPVPVRDLPFAVLLFLAALAPGMHGYGTQIGAVADRPFDGLGVLVVALETLPLAVRRRSPLLCIGLIVAAFAADQLLGYHTVGGTALPIALLSTAAHLKNNRRTTMAALTGACVLLYLALLRVGGSEPLTDAATFYLACVLCWGIGSWLRSTRAAEAEHRLRIAEATRTAERTRIARELHDVVTHHVTAMVVQTEAARYLTAAPDRLDQTLASVSGTGRRAITDLRHLLELLNPDHGAEPRTPTAGDLHALVAQTVASGQPVELTEEGERAESAGSADVVVYRVVQEALTNALKYDYGARTTVRVRYGVREMSVEVGTDGSGSDAGSPGGSGRGLAGLRERVGVLGGEFSAGPRPGGGFAVTARIPVGSRV